MKTPLCHLDPVHFQFMVERAGQEIYLVQRDGTLAFVNDAAARSVGYSVEELKGAHLSLIDPDFGPRFAAHFDELAARDQPVFETTHQTKDSRLVAKEMRSVHLCIGEQEFICGYGQDITERKASEARRHEAQKMEAVGRLAGGISHDFNNLLTAILGYAETIGMRLPAHDPNAADAREIKAAALRAASLTRQLRETSTPPLPCFASHGGSETVLLVEDEPIVRKLARLTLEESGYRVLSADNPMEAIEICRLEPSEIDLLLTDVVMPEMNGVALFDAIHRLRPSTVVLFMSGYPGDALTRQGLIDKNAMLLCKPFTVSELSAKVREALRQRGS